MKAIDRIHTFLKFGIVLGLDRMNELLRRLGDPHEDLEVIHVAGTNGKGSICRYIYEMLRAGGYHTGLFTSPYLEVFNERIEIDGEYISDEEIEQYGQMVIEKADEMVADGWESPTEFEVVTALAFLYFHEIGCDFCVLEVGLGGRGDSTNVVKHPLCSVIASISLDHTDRLGSTIPEIAFEKAGIIKEGCPVVVSTELEDARAVFRKRASDLRAPLFDSSRADVKVVREDLEGTGFTVTILEHLYRGIRISMGGRYQVQNAVAALYAITILRQQGKLDLSDRDIKEGMQRAKQIGRMEILARDPYVIIDGAHNPDASLQLAKTCEKYFVDKKILMVTGILADKDVDQVLDNFCSITHEFIVTEPPNPRKMNAQELSDRLRAHGADCTAIEDPYEAAKEAAGRRMDYDLVLFTGSLYLIGSIRRTIIDAI